ncbi:hypothetical protein C922_03806 [Plasmodium inui San Antonio 1]|uniref:Uncharacterized protein n=1 Tax=Plasmodium inui San Antonio 1 TaxID=1237626 RepID=W7A3A6_9APIC|nr:hypothetical protein C922_03806 [Plasmodium inui San Antonio 1]EUD65823.1 hypothetical protein C922_03806 [Plasmodium inui San Antonio 1]
MEVHMTEWEDRQCHLESIIKKQFYNKDDDIKGRGDYQNVGGFISRKKFEMEEPCKCYNCEHVILVVTEYVQKECILDRYVLAYKNLLQNIDSYIHEIRSKSDIDHNVYRNFLSKDDPPCSRNANKKCSPGGTSVGEDRQDVEMETYTISTIMTIRTKILNTLPMLKRVLSQLSPDEHSDYYVSSRVGIIERVKNKIHNYVLCRGTSCTYESLKIGGGKASQVRFCEDVRLGTPPRESNDRYDGVGNRDWVGCQDYSDRGEEGSDQCDHYHGSDNNYHYERCNNRGEQPQHTDGACPSPQRRGKPEEAQPRGGADRMHAEYSTRRRKEAPVKFYEIIITTNQNLISLRSIHLLIEMVSLFHRYLMKFVLEKKRNEKINLMQLYHLRKKEYTFCDESNYLLFYNFLLGKLKRKKKKKKRKSPSRRGKKSEWRNPKERITVRGGPTRLIIAQSLTAKVREAVRRKRCAL